MRAFEFATGAPWAIQQQSLKQIVEIAQRIHEPNWEAVALRRADRVMSDVLEMRGSVAVLNVVGPIFRYANLFTSISGATSIEAIARSLGMALQDPNVEAILLNLDSPGGELSGISELAAAVKAARSQKTVWAYVDDLAASGAYWLASAAERIIISDTARVGSIGVIATEREEADPQGVVTYNFISSISPKKHPDMATEEGRQTLQETVDELGMIFVRAVAQNRAVSEDKVISDFGQGWLLTSNNALQVGAADEIGSFEKAVEKLSGTQVRGVPQLSSVGPGRKALALKDSPLAAACVRQIIRHSRSNCVVLSYVEGLCQECQRPIKGGAHVVGQDLLLFCADCCRECKFAAWDGSMKEV